jgi:hypothetical protein
LEKFMISRLIFSAALALLAAGGCFDGRSAAWGQAGVPGGCGPGVPCGPGSPAAAIASATYGYIGGCTLSNDIGTPNTVIDITKCVVSSDDGTTSMVLVAFTKTTGTWAVGSGNGCLDTGSVSASSWYALFVIERIDTGVVDEVCTKTSAGVTPSPTLPTNYTKKRYVGSFRTNGASNILAFTQRGDEFTWTYANQPQDVNVTNLGTTTTNFTLTIPLGIVVKAHMRAFVIQAASAVLVVLSSPDEGTMTVNSPVGQDSCGTGLGNVGQTCDLYINSNASGQIAATAASANFTFLAVTVGWVDLARHLN